MTDRYRANITRYTTYRLFRSLLIIGPVLTPYLPGKGLNYAQILTLQSIAAVSVVVFEIPTGAIADKVSRKLSLTLSTLLHAHLHLRHRFRLPGRRRSAVRPGSDVRKRSGFGHPVRESRPDRKERRLCARRESDRLSLVRGSGHWLCGEQLALRHRPEPAVWLQCRLYARRNRRRVAPPRTRSCDQYAHLRRPRLVEPRGDATRAGTPVGLGLTSTMGLVYRTGFWLYEPYLKLNDVPVAWYGTIFFIFNVIAALVARLGGRIRRERRALLLALQQIVRGLYRPTLTAYVNERIRDENRATMISIVGVAPNLAFAAFSPFVGLAFDRLGVVATYVSVGTISVVGWMMLLTTRVKELTRRESRLDSLA